MFNLDKFQSTLNTRTLGRTVKYRSFTGSTNSDLRQLCESADLIEGMLLFTDHQTDGRGRGANKWYSSADHNLTFSLLVKPKFTLERSGLLALMAGIGTLEGMQSAAKIQAGLKWPNDILLNGKKVGGVLTETFTVQDELWAILGIGINVNEPLSGFPEILRYSATSLYVETGKTQELEPLLSEILNHLELASELEPEQVIQFWTQYCGHLGMPIKFHSGDAIIGGHFAGVTEDGHAILRIGSRNITFSAGEVEL